MSALPRPSSIEATGSVRFRKRRPLPALALPHAREDRRAGALLSVVLHVLVILLLVTPFAVHHEIIEREQGAGGAGPAGGGGGGRAGSGGAPESEGLQFIRVAPPATPQASPVPSSQIVPPTPVPPPEPVKVVETPKVEAKIDAPTPVMVPEIATLPGVGGGSGHDGTNGNGSGTGGGAGSGIGTGRGSGVGPGTGGGAQENHPPQPIELFIPPVPVPDKVRGSHIIAEFDVDSTGRVLGMDFTHTKDRDYNKRLEEAFRGFRFRSGTRPDGSPLRMKAQIEFVLP
jgi:periplasmic protein TonB